MQFKGTIATRSVLCFLLAAWAAPDVARAAPVAVQPAAQASVQRSPIGAYEKVYVAAVKAYRAKRNVAFLRAAQQALALRPEHPPARYLVATALIANGKAVESLAELGALADLGIAFSPELEPAFQPLREDDRFQAILARFAENLQPVGAAELVLEAKNLPGDFIPESLAWDAERERWLLGSIRQRRIVALAADGKASDLVAAGENLYSAQGMAVVADQLLVASSALRQTAGLDEATLGRTGIFAFALSDGRPRGRWLLETGQVGALGDLLPLAGGHVLAGDGAGGGVYMLNRATGRYVTIVAPGQLASPQGMAALDARRVAVADYESGLYALALDVATALAPSDSAPSSVSRTRRQARNALVALTSKDPAALYGIDGLYAHGDSLIAIQNGTRPQRILRLRLDAAKRAIEKVEVLAANRPEWDEPTLGAVVGDAFYFVANSHWPRFGANGELPPAAELSPPRIMKVDL